MRGDKRREEITDPAPVPFTANRVDPFQFRDDAGHVISSNAQAFRQIGPRKHHLASIDPESPEHMSPEAHSNPRPHRVSVKPVNHGRVLVSRQHHEHPLLRLALVSQGSSMDTGQRSSINRQTLDSLDSRRSLISPFLPSPLP